MKKIMAIMMAIVMVAALAACGNGGSTTPATTAANAETKGEAAADETYTYTVDTGNYENVWTLALLSDGSYTLTEHNGLLNVDTEHTGKSFTKNDDKIECGPWDNADGVPDFCAKDGSVTWQVSGDKIEPFIDLSNASALCGVYTYVQDRGDFEMTYTVTLNYDWTWSIEIYHGLRESSETFTGDTWEELSDTSFKTGPRDIEETERDFFDADGSCVWNIVGDGQVEPENEDPNAAGSAEGSINPGKYTYIDETPMGVTTWELGLNGSGSGHLGTVEDEAEYSFDTWTDNGDGTITTSALDALPEHVPGWMGEDGSSTWKINDDGTCEPVEGGAAPGGATINPGRYTYIDETPMGVTTWQLGLNGNGAGHLGTVEEDIQYSFESWTDNGNGTITTSALDTLPEHVPGWMNEDGSSTWKINPDETCEPVEGGAAPAGAAEVNPGKYSFVEETPRATITWGVGVFGNGGGMIEITEDDGEPVRHDYESWTDNGDGTVTTGKWIDGTDGVELPDWFEPDGSCTWRLNADETLEPVRKK